MHALNRKRINISPPLKRKKNLTTYRRHIDNILRRRLNRVGARTTGTNTHTSSRTNLATSPSSTTSTKNRNISKYVISIMDCRVAKGTNNFYPNANFRFAVWIYNSNNPRMKEFLLSPRLKSQDLILITQIFRSDASRMPLVNQIRDE